MNQFGTLALWYLDRSSGLVLVPALWVAVLTGVFVRTRVPCVFHDISIRYHLRVSVFSISVLIIHAAIGTLDAVLVVTGNVPAPNYPVWFFVVGTIVGAGAFATVLVAVSSFIAPSRFTDPALVHALAYVGFGVGVLHAVALGTDMGAFARSLLWTSLAFVVVGLCLKLVVDFGLARRVRA